MTVHINLLDWRRARREKRKQQYTAMLGLGVLIAGAIIGAGYLTMTGKVENQEARNTYLRQQIKEMDDKIKEIQELEKVRNNLLARMRVVEELQASRTATVHFFDELINTLPEGVNLTSIRQSGGNVTINGVAESNGRISTYMKNLDGSAWFAEPKLVVIKSNDKNRRRRSEFTLQVKNLTKPDAAAASTDEGTSE
ncbi:MAG TPA: PilN domain-containing protein [Solimonas sp.]|jgi:type IV pilus assembly protein PilN|nr:PilN domain-containing protein [Solimonas sp.]